MRTGWFSANPDRARAERFFLAWTPVWMALMAPAGTADAVIQRRMANAREEVSHAPEFDYAIINKDFDAARQDMAAVIRAARARTPLQLARHPELFKGN